MTRLISLTVVAFAVLIVVAGERPHTSAVGTSTTEIIVLLDSPPLAEAPGMKSEIDAEQQAFRRALAVRVPAARVGWRYRLVANGFSVTMPSSQVPRLQALPGVRDVLPSATYGPQLDRTPQQIGAPALWS